MVFTDTTVGTEIFLSAVCNDSSDSKITSCKQNILKVVHKLGLLAHFTPWSTFGLRDISKFWVQKIRQEKSTNFTTILNYIKSSCAKLF